jgi:succinate dehydrogenase / fumarate reductase iron-sulfur subunit
MTTRSRKITFKILRYKPGIIDPARFHHYRLTVGSHATVLDCLEQIRLRQDHTLMYRHSCHHASCGTCGCIINGVEALACTTPIDQFESDPVILTPLQGFPRVGDLAVDLTPLFKDLSSQWSGLEPLPQPSSDATADATPTKFENCIECGSCVSVCPAVQENSQFMGPASLAAINREMIKNPEQSKKLLALAKGERGERHCRRHLACSKVCPTGVYPARHIADIRKK